MPLKKLGARTRCNGKRLNFVLCTNLANVTDDILAFCATNQVLVSTSLDGAAFIHRANRPTAEAMASHFLSMDSAERDKLLAMTVVSLNDHKPSCVGACADDRRHLCRAWLLSSYRAADPSVRIRKSPAARASIWRR